MRRVVPVYLLLLMLTGCRDGIVYVQPKLKTERGYPVVQSGQLQRNPPTDTVAQEDPQHPKDPYWTGLEGDRYVTKLPVPLTLALLQRGRERFEITCAPCHGRTAEGDGMVVRRGFPHPPSFHTDALREAPIGHFFVAMTHGWGVMYSYADRVSVPDRWAIAAYIRALQASRHVSERSVPADVQKKLDAQP